jgi:hypothetical protein
MTSSPDGPRKRHRLVTGLLVAACVTIAVEAILLVRGFPPARTVAAAPGEFRAASVEDDSAGGSGVHIRLRNVRFRWSDEVYIDTGNMAVRAVALRGPSVNFDDPRSFHLVVQQSVVLIRPEVLAGMFNESVFNYPGSRVRDLRVVLSRDDHGVPTVELHGHLKVVASVPFTMYTHLSADTATNALVIEVDHLKAFGVIPVTKLIRWTPLSLSRLIALPPNKSLFVDGNRILVTPFGLFPPPRISGTIAGVEVSERSIRITFAGEAIPAPASTATNYAFLRGGSSQFGSFRMTATNILVLDQDPSTPFGLSLQHYAEAIPRSRVELFNTHAVQITMPDL